DRKDDHPPAAPNLPSSARFRMGHRFSVFYEPRRAAAGRLLWPYRLHRNVLVDRSHDQYLHNPAGERCSSPRKGKCRELTHKGRNRGGGCARAVSARKRRPALENYYRLQRSPNCRAPSGDKEWIGFIWYRRSRARQFRRAALNYWKEENRPAHESDRRGCAGASND